jgi:hypothetical protein
MYAHKLKQMLIIRLSARCDLYWLPTLYGSFVLVIHERLTLRSAVDTPGD